MTKKYLITGGAGFIGSHLAEKILATGNHVTVIDNLSTGRRSNVELLRQTNAKNFNFVEGDVCNSELVLKSVGQVDYVFHLAAAIGLDIVVHHPERSLSSNVLGTHSVLAACKTHSRPCTIASTSEVYGLSTDIPFSEDQPLTLGSPKVSRWNYACAKLLDEFWAMAYHQEYNCRVSVTRFFNTVGPRQSGEYGMVVPRFVKWALAGEAIQIYGNGEQTRSFCHVTDTVAALQKLENTPAAIGEVINIGHTREMTIAELAMQVKTQLKSNSEIVKKDYQSVYGRPFQDMMRRLPNIAKAKTLLNWEPKIGIEKIIDDVASWYREHGTKTW